MVFVTVGSVTKHMYIHVQKQIQTLSAHSVATADILNSL